MKKASEYIKENFFISGVSDIKDNLPVGRERFHSYRERKV